MKPPTAPGLDLVAMGEKGYPAALSHVDAPPPLLYVKGRLELAEGPIVAMVGARNGSAVGQKLTRQLATELVESSGADAWTPSRAVWA